MSLSYTRRLEGKKGTSLWGHSLRDSDASGTFRATCQCGATSDEELVSRPRRLKWQREHLQQVAQTGVGLHELTQTEEFGVALCTCGEKSVAGSTFREKLMWMRVHRRQVLEGQEKRNVKVGELSQRAGLSVRQLDHWTRLGYLTVQTRKNAERVWGPTEQLIAIDMGRLIRSGFTVEAAAHIARLHVESPSASGAYELLPGVSINL